MTDHEAGLFAIALLIILIFFRIPVGVALALAGFLGNVFFQGFEPAIVQLQLVTWEMATNFVLITIPLFVWMGQLAQVSDMGRDLYKSFHTWFGRTPGGLAITAIASSASFGAITGSSVATVTAMGNMLMPEMKRYQYDDSLSSGALASAGVLAILIPPSIPLVFYAAWTESSLGDLFVAGVIPGILLASVYSIYVLIYCTINPEKAPKGKHFSWVEKWHSLYHLLPAVFVLLTVLVSIYAGIATPTEAAAIGVAGVLVIGFCKRKISLSSLKKSINESALLSCNIFVLLLGGVFFSRFMAQTQLTQSLIEWVAALSLSPPLLILLLVAIYLVLGAILDTFGMIILTLPFVFPLIVSQGIDPIWFGIFLVLMIELSLITPPIGINVFVMQKVSPELTLGVIYRGTFPYVLLTLSVVALLVAFPELALWLPEQMK